MAEDFKTGLTRRAVLERAAAGGALLVAAPLWACGSNSGSATTSKVVIAVPDTPSSLDTDLGGGVEGFEAQHNIYDSLTSFPFLPPRDNVTAWDISSLENVEPQLAADFTQSRDGKTTTFKLRKGVMSSAGNELTTADIAFQFNVLAANSKSLRGLPAQLGNFDPTKGIEIRDKYTFIVNHEKPSPLFLAGVALVLAGIHDSRAVKQHVTKSDPTGSKWLGTNAVGFGPYKLDTLSRGEQAVFSARDDYWGGKAKVGTVISRAVPQSSNRLALVSNGNAQIATGLSPVQLQRADVTADHPSNLELFVTFQVNNPPFDDINVRRAFQYATDYDAILSSVFRGTARRLYGPLPDTYPDNIGKELNRYEYDPAMAKKLLAKAGYDRLEVEMIYATSKPNSADVSLQLQAAWRKAGIDVKLTAVSALQWGTLYIGGKFKHLIMFEDQANIPDMGYVSNLLFVKGGVANGGHYDNPEVNRLTARSIATVDAEERTEIAHELQRLLIDDPPVVYIAQPGKHYALADPVTTVGWETDNGLVYNKIA